MGLGGRARSGASWPGPRARRDWEPRPSHSGLTGPCLSFDNCHPLSIYNVFSLYSEVTQFPRRGPGLQLEGQTPGPSVHSATSSPRPCCPGPELCTVPPPPPTTTHTRTHTQTQGLPGAWGSGQWCHGRRPGGKVTRMAHQGFIRPARTQLPLVPGGPTTHMALGTWWLSL